MENVSTQTLAESIADILELSLSEVTVVAGETPGTYTVTLADGRVFIVAPLGPAFRHQSALQRQLAQSESGYLHLRTQTQLELQLRSAIFHEAALVGEMLRLGWTNFSWFDNGVEVDSPQGVHYCFAPDLRATMQGMGGTIAASLDADGNLVVAYPDGIRQRLHACAHDFAQLRDQIRLQVQQQLAMNPDGTFFVLRGGQFIRYRLQAELHDSGIIDAPGLYQVGSRLFMRYRDGWEQDIVIVN
ncbi:MAG: hypothetical protein ACO1PZ_06195 [Gammaproteobacteria bacterium]